MSDYPPVKPPCGCPRAPTIYLAGATNHVYLEFTIGQRVLETFAYLRPGMSHGAVARSYRPLWKGAMIDSGAFSAHMSGTPIDMGEYREFLVEKGDFYVAAAGLDVISDWRASVANWRAMQDVGVFPTFHEGEPWELLRDYAEEQAKTGGWLGFGAQRPIIRHRLVAWLHECKEAMGDLTGPVHCHGFGLSMYTSVFPFASTDSTSWVLGTQKLMETTQLNHLTKTEMMDIIYARLQRAPFREHWDPGWAEVLSRAEQCRDKLDPAENALEMFGGTDE